MLLPIIMKKRQKICLMPRTLPGYTGFTSIIDNVGSVENKGLEFEISGRSVNRNCKMEHWL